jgi:DNA-binding NarL/FixJ family response regulator
VTVSVVIADDQELVRTGFRLILESEDDIEVVGEATNGLEAVTLANKHRPDVVLMDIRMPELDGIAATQQLTARHGEPPTRVLILTTFDLDEYVFDALRAGASGFLLKDAAASQLAAGVRMVAAGDALLAPTITRRLIEEFAGSPPLEPPPGLDELTPRELQILRLVGKGKIERRHRRRTDHRRNNRQDPRRSPTNETRTTRPHPNRRARLRDRHRYPQQPPTSDIDRADCHS